MFNPNESDTKTLLQFCFGYFFFYVINGVVVKFFQGSPALGMLGMSDIEYTIYSTIGGNLLTLIVVLLWKWFNLKSCRLVNVLGVKIPIEFFYIIPSGMCTGIIIPTTTLMYSLPISVMVAMVIMRGSIIVISRLIDAAQLWQGILHKKVYWEENVAVIFALFAVGTNIFFARPGDFEFLKSAPAMIIFISYIIAYTLRIYIMNYYKNTHGKGVKQDNKGFFAIEQIGASFTILAIGILAFNSPSFFHWNPAQIQSFRQGIMDPGNFWAWAILGGTAYGAVSFFSVFIFMFKGRTATFAGLVNRLTSLVAGTAATLIFCLAFKGKFPSGKDWLSLLFVLIAVGFIARSEKKRVDELKREPLVNDVCEVIGKR